MHVMKGKGNMFAPQMKGRVAPYPHAKGMAPMMLQPVGFGSFCTGCGNPMAANHTFCSVCGTRRSDAGGCLPMNGKGSSFSSPMAKGGCCSPMFAMKGVQGVQKGVPTHMNKGAKLKTQEFRQPAFPASAKFESFKGKGAQAFKGAHGTGGAKGGFRANVRPGDWECPKCNDVQFSRNKECRKCGAARPKGLAPILPPKPGDWTCPECGDFQFGHNEKCRQCGTEKPDLESEYQETAVEEYAEEEWQEEQEYQQEVDGEPPGMTEEGQVEYEVQDEPHRPNRPVFTGASPAKKMLPGDWECPGCGDVNFARNATCRKCNHERPEGAGNIARMQPGDWLCPKCDDLQFARNTSCRKCRAPRPADYVPAI